MTTSVPADPWLLTATGRRFSFLNPNPEDVKLHDIAIHLGNLNRFVGATRVPWTVAEHCVLVALMMRMYGQPADYQLCGLFHDAAEAYTGDVSTPMKWAVKCLDPNGLSHFQEIERRVVSAIWTRFRLHPHVMPDSKIVKQFDLMALATEARDLLPATLCWPGDVPKPFEYETDTAMTMAREVFLGGDLYDLAPAALFHLVAKSLFREVWG